MDSPRIRRWAWRGLWLIAAAVAAITFWPTPVDQPVRRLLDRALAYLHRHGLPSWVTYAFVESASNVAMFVPIGVAVAILVARSRWWFSALVGFIASSAIEFAQFVFLPQRFATVADVAANTTGALLGGLLVCLLRHVIDAREPPSAAGAADGPAGPRE